MPHARCAHCGTEIADHFSMVERGGQAYCCDNCLAMLTGQVQTYAGQETCAHCRMPITEPSTRGVRSGQSFCCNNCSIAMAQGMRHRG